MSRNMHYKKHNRKYILKSINKNIKISRPSFVTLIITSILLIPVSFISPYLFGILIDLVMKKGQFELFKFIALGLFGVYILKLVLEGINLYYSNQILNNFTFKIRSKLWKQYLQTDYADFTRKDAADYKMRFYDDINSIGNFHKEQIVEFTFNLMMIVLAVVLTIYINYKLTLICVLVIPLVILVNKMIGKGFNGINEEIREATETYYSFEHETLQNWKEIKTLHVEDTFIERFKMHRKKLAKLGYKWVRYWFCQEVFNDFKLNYLTKILIYVSGAFFVISKEITVGELVIFSEYFAILFNNIDELSRKNVQLKINQPYYDRVIDILNEPSKKDFNYNQSKESLTGDIVVSGVDFGYTENMVLKNINFSIKNGDVTAITGDSGCGKTTLVKLLLNLYKPNKGNIVFDGKVPAEIRERAFYQSIGAVMQDGYIFNMSIKDNLRLAKAEATDGECEEVCRKSDIWDWVKSLSDGLDTLIGEQGIKISGGQKQRLLIARELLKEPQIMIFDEATSALDSFTEDKVMKNIRESFGDKTFIYITHRKYLTLDLDKVIDIEKPF